jgi:hypothetical protein
MATLSSFTAANPFYGGCTLRELATLFKMPLATVKDRIVGLAPSGRRGSSDVYAIPDAARRLVSALDDDELVRQVLRTKHTELPPTLRREFWMAELNRQKVEERAGNLWPTDLVVQKAGDAFKTLRLSLQLLSDQVERNETLTNKQRQIILNLVDMALQDMRDKLIDGFRSHHGREPALDEAGASDQDLETADL